MSIQKSRESGFTLIEVMVAMLILSVGMLAMASMLITGIKVNHVSEQRMNAATLAQSVMTHIDTFAQTNTAAATKSDAESHISNLSAIYTPTVTIDTADDPYSWFIQVDLAWSNRGETRNTTLYSTVAFP